MSEQFKPGDVVRSRHATLPTFVVAEVMDTGLLRVEENDAGLLYAEPDLVEFVEPSVPVRKIREVCEELLGSAELDLQHETACMRDQGRTKAMYAYWFYRELTGEPLQKETP